MIKDEIMAQDLGFPDGFSLRREWGPCDCGLTMETAGVIGYLVFPDGGFGPFILMAGFVGLLQLRVVNIREKLLEYDFELVGPLFSIPCTDGDEHQRFGL